jgi:predicted Fe-S protein YdhL (DUF1289 family)
MHEVWRRETVESPCVKTCLIHPQARLCIGCLRTMDEIAGWTRMSDEERRTIMAALPSRAQLLTGARRGGREGRRARGGAAPD